MKKYDYLIVNDNLATIVEYHKPNHGKYILNVTNTNIMNPNIQCSNLGLLILGYVELEYVSGSLHSNSLYTSHQSHVKKINYHP